MTLQPVSNPAISELKMPFDPETQEPGIASCDLQSLSRVTTTKQCCQLRYVRYNEGQGHSV